MSKELFIKDELLDVYTEELTSILESIDQNEIPEDYKELVAQNVDVILGFISKIKI